MPILSMFGSLFSDDPQLRLFQMTLAGFGALFLFLLLFTLRDILLRTRSFSYQLLCIVLVALLPGLGFLLYLLIRPARTVKQREAEAMLRALVTVLSVDDEEEHIEEEFDDSAPEPDMPDEATETEGEEQEEDDDNGDAKKNPPDKSRNHAHTHRHSHA